jgi:hypothetical protein
MYVVVQALLLCRTGRVEKLSRGRVGAVVVYLTGRPVRCRAAIAHKGFAGDFGGFFSRLFEVAVVSPEVGSVFAAVYEDTARPGCTYAYVVSDQAKDRVTHSI